MVNIVLLIIVLTTYIKSQVIKNVMQLGPKASDEGLGIGFKYEHGFNEIFYGLELGEEHELGPIFGTQNIKEGRTMAGIPISFKMIGRFTFLDLSTGIRYSQFTRLGRAIKSGCPSFPVLSDCYGEFKEKKINSFGVPIEIASGIKLKNVGISFGYGIDVNSHKITKSGTVALWFGY